MTIDDLKKMLVKKLTELKDIYDIQVYQPTYYPKEKVLFDRSFLSKDLQTILLDAWNQFYKGGSFDTYYAKIKPNLWYLISIDRCVAVTVFRKEINPVIESNSKDLDDLQEVEWSSKTVKAVKLPTYEEGKAWDGSLTTLIHVEKSCKWFEGTMKNCVRNEIALPSNRIRLEFLTKEAQEWVLGKVNELGWNSYSLSYVCENSLSYYLYISQHGFGGNNPIYPFINFKYKLPKVEPLLELKLT